MPREIESMTQVWTPRYRIRVWRAETEIREEYDNQDIHNFVHNGNDENTSNYSPKDIIEGIGNLPRVNAVEVVNKYTMSGTVAYFVEW